MCKDFENVKEEFQRWVNWDSKLSDGYELGFHFKLELIFSVYQIMFFYNTYFLIDCLDGRVINAHASCVEGLEFKSRASHQARIQPASLGGKARTLGGMKITKTLNKHLVKNLPSKACLFSKVHFSAYLSLNSCSKISSWITSKYR